MPQGLQIFDSLGNLKLDSNKRPSRIVSYFDSGVVAGSVTLLADSNIQYFTVVIPSTVTGLCPPTTTIAANVISWDWLAPSANRASATIIIGAM